MADNLKAHKLREPRIRKDIPKTVKRTREKVTSIPGCGGAPASSAERAAEGMVAEAAGAAYTPAVGEMGTIPVHIPARPGGMEETIVGLLVRLAKFTRRKPGVSVALAGAAGLILGLGARRF